MALQDTFELISHIYLSHRLQKQRSSIVISVKLLCHSTRFQNK